MSSGKQHAKKSMKPASAGKSRKQSSIKSYTVAESQDNDISVQKQDDTLGVYEDGADDEGAGQKLRMMMKAMAQRHPKKTSQKPFRKKRS